MDTGATTPFVVTIKELCRMCYTCVRECPAKAIRISEGQAEVLPERCIACGNCVKVCSQKAKQVISTIAEVEQLLAGEQRIAACIAPSFPAEFTECDYEQLVGMLRQLGFHLVVEVAFGADLVADRYRRLSRKIKNRRYIATTCPAVVSFVERYYPECAGSLAPIVSPMVATARALRLRHGSDLRTVFIGPCIAKKVEAKSTKLAREIDSVITFSELRDMFSARGITPGSVTPSPFDPPHPSLGSLFPISRGLLQAAGIREDLMGGHVVATSGRATFPEALREFAEGNLDANLLEVLCCQGCIMGPGMFTTAPLFRRRSRVSRYARNRITRFNHEQWRKEMLAFKTLDLSRSFVTSDQRIPVPSTNELSEILARMGKFKPEDELNCGACGYDTCRLHAVAVIKGLAESEMCLPYTIDKLRTTVKELAMSNEQLANVQEALMQSEKLASMGQLAAGIAHELNNPLGVVLMYAHLLLESARDNEAVREDVDMIATQAERCRKIVSGLLHFARQNRVLRHPTDLHAVIEKSIQSVPRPENISVSIVPGLSDSIAEVDGDQLIQVFTNLLSNAYAAMPEGGSVSIETSGDAEMVHFSVKDAGTGIPPDVRKKIFEPFFTTKQIGMGTGLGLAVAYGIIKMHRGDIRVISNVNPAQGPTGTTFIIDIPRKDIEEKLEQNSEAK